MLSIDAFAHFLYRTREFNVSMEQPDGAFFEPELVNLRSRLILEEWEELKVEIDAAIAQIEEGYLVSPGVAMQIMKELADLEYVVAGACATFAIPHAPQTEYDVRVFFLEDGCPDGYISDKESLIAARTRLELDVSSALNALLDAASLDMAGGLGGAVSPLAVYQRVMASMSFLTERILWVAELLGIDIVSVFNEVHASNMSKLGEDGRPVYREDGKVLKGPNYRKPDLSKFIEGREDVAKISI